ncbi:mitochondrial 37S ribosomal protein bS18m [Kwoniella pini CBS 10737]|uniref:Small ribosomal subunit protein bS18m n=1 Tax=Kwoniella pini CBS 10737 TaxID=1296096 RepID=A0A1B9HSS2_9TREE|nr:ribosomal protein S18 [Kwoniella pini CBS 10737]OCF46325.1 ribosomal protein S18 [Kwoniella pini CBS 10737]
MVRPPLSVRMLHTSLPHRAPSARESIASAISSSSLSNSDTTSTADAARKMLDSLTSRVKTEADEKRKPFRANSYAPPHSFNQNSLYPEPRPYAKAPLLGPSKKIASQIDPFYLSKTSPINHYLNPLFSLNFVNPMGKIKSRSETGLTWKSQKKIGKLVRRARSMGIISRWSNQTVAGGLGTSMGRIGGRY